MSGVDSIRLGLAEESDLEDEVANFDIRYRGRRAATGVPLEGTPIDDIIATATVVFDEDSTEHETTTTCPRRDSALAPR